MLDTSLSEVDPPIDKGGEEGSSLGYYSVGDTNQKLSLDPIDDQKKKLSGRFLVRWRIKALSATELAVVLPLFFVLAWITRAVMSSFF